MRMVVPTVPDEWPALLTVAEVAQILRVAPVTVRRMILSGELPGVKIGNQWRVRADDLRRLMQPKPVELAGGRIHPGAAPDS